MLNPNPLKKLKKVKPKKSYKPKNEGKLSFFHIYFYSWKFLVCNFFLVWLFFYFFNGFGFSIKFCVFWYPSYLYIKNFFVRPFKHFLETWNKIRMEWLKQNKNAFSKCVLEFIFAPISGPYFFIFQKRSKSMYPSVHWFCLIS